MSTSLNQHFTPWALLKFAFPSIIMMIFMSLYTIVDGIYISRFLGSNALSSLNIVFPVINVVIAIATMLGTGGNAIISKYLGEGKNQEARECLTSFTVIGLAVSILLLILTQVFLIPICRILGSTDILLADCQAYLSTSLMFAPACMLQTLFQSYLVTAGMPALGLFLTIGSRYSECGSGLRSHSGLPYGNHRRCPGHRYRPVRSGHRRVILFPAFPEGPLFHPFPSAWERTSYGLL